MLKRRKKDLLNNKKTKLVWHTCRECKVNKIRTYESVISVVCEYCLLKHVGMPETPAYLQPGSGRPRGWHFKKYFEFEGKVYSKGTEITDPSEIEKLKSSHKKTSSKKSVKPSRRGRPRANTTK